MVKEKLRETKLVPKSLNQETYILNLLDCKKSIVIAHGPAGSGKTYLAMIAAIRCLREGNCERIILTRPAVEVDDEKLGFLPGTLEEKMAPWTQPLLDVFREFYTPFDIEKMIANKTIEIIPLAFMRGRTLRDAWIIGDELQSASINQMKMLLTRIGSGSRIVVTGDQEQTERRFCQENGLKDIIERLNKSPNDNIAICELTHKDIHRHPIIKEVLDLYS